MGHCPICGITLTMGDTREQTDEKKHMARHAERGETVERT